MLIMMIIVESGLMTKLMAMGHIYTTMGRNTLAIGIPTSNMVKGKKLGLMVQDTKAIIPEAKSMARENFTGLTILVMKEASLKTIYKDM